VTLPSGSKVEWDNTPKAPHRHRKIAILGFAETVKQAPVNDPSWELWGMNGFWRAALPDYGIDVPESRYTLWFDMHSVEYTRAYGLKAGFGDAQERWLEQPHPFTVFMLDESPAFPSVLSFPVDAVAKSAGRDYFTSTVAYAIAYAASLPDVAEIGLWGIDLAHDTEYSDQRPCAEYHIALAEGRGIKVTTHQNSALLKQRYRYGYEPPDSLGQAMRASLEHNASHLQGVLEADKEEMEKLKSRLHTNDGALQLIRTMLGRLDLWERGGRF
jgi:hypothetical protein